MSKGWIGVDLDRTLAHYDHWRGAAHIGAPIMPMVRRVNHWLAEGRDVRIFTARVFVPPMPAFVSCPEWPEYERRDKEASLATRAIRAFCTEHFGRELPITCQKDFDMIELWDDRAVQLVPNTGIPIELISWESDGASGRAQVHLRGAESDLPAIAVSQIRRYLQDLAVRRNRGGES